MPGFDVVGFGALNVDTLFNVDKIAGRDDESFVTKHQQACGGSAANTIVGLTRLGLKTGFVGKVADDREGQLLLDDFRREGVNTDGIVIEKTGRSGIVMGFVDKKGERALYVAPGVNDTIKVKQSTVDYASRASILHMTSFVGEESFESQKKLVGKLPQHVRVSFDPGSLYAKRGLTPLRPIIRRAFVMLPNAAELKLLTGKGHVEGSERLRAEGVRIVAVKLGERGCFVTNGEESHVIEPFKIRVVDTTGAGDAWNAGFLYGLLHSKSLRECGRLGNFAASRCITAMGARKGLPRLADLPGEQ